MVCMLTDWAEVNLTAKCRKVNMATSGIEIVIGTSYTDSIMLAACWEGGMTTS